MAANLKMPKVDDELLNKSTSGQYDTKSPKKTIFRDDTSNQD